MLSILYLALESLTVILPILLAVAWVLERQSLFYLAPVFAIFVRLLVWAVISFLLYYLFLGFFDANLSFNFLLVIFPFPVKSIPLNKAIQPWFITGFTDGEGSFFLSIVESKTNKIGWNVTIGFNLVGKNNPANYAMFISIKNYFGVGQVITGKNDKYVYFTVNGLSNCLIIRDQFINYPLMSYKLVHFNIWSAVIDLLLAKEHLNLIGLLKIIALKAHSPLGLSEKLLLTFPNYTPVSCFDYKPDLALINIHWIAGFINADGSFGLQMQNTTTKFRILITQHSKSLILMEAIVKFLGVGKIYEEKSSILTVKIFNINGVNIFISKFAEAKLLGAKALDYVDFCQAIELINSKAHLTPEGKAAYRTIAAGMNSTRTNFSSVTPAL